VFNLDDPVDATILSPEEQLRQVRDQLVARQRDREGLKLQFQKAKLANDAAQQTSVQVQADAMTLEIQALEQLEQQLAKGGAPKNVKK
jgi:hypothetical protein